jgi:hypothetical protein
MSFVIKSKSKPSAPIRGFVFPKVSAKEEILKNEFLSDDKSNPIILGYMFSFTCMPGIEGAFQGGAVTQGEYKTYIEELIKPQTDGSFSPAWIETGSQNVKMANINEIVIGLVSASKKKNLETEHMSGYYASLGVDTIPTGKICKLINSMKGYFPEITSTKGYENIRYDDTWQDYRESLTSWKSILEKCGDDLVKVGAINQAKLDDLLKVDVKQKSTINACPKKLLFIMATYMEAADKMPGKWYQGNKAINENDPKKVKALVKGWKKYFALGSDESAIDAASTQAEVASALNGII